MEFNEKLQLLRTSKGISQEKLADEIGVPTQLVMKWELGEETPDMHDLMALSDWFNISLDELLRDRISLMTLNHLGIFEHEDEIVEHNLVENSLLIIGMILMIMSFIFNHLIIGGALGILSVGIYYLFHLKKHQ
ncbi:MAG: helix-turn-helix domain-containing protein [Turicibacter sp.]|nr:helix-turn-helix domain-containing protein [Turicibacter sp.]